MNAMLNEMIALFRGAVLLQDETFKGLKASPDVFRKGFTFLLMIGLIVGLVNGVAGMVQGLTANPAADITGLEDLLKQFMGSNAETILYYLRMSFRIVERVTTEGGTPLPKAVQVLFAQLGNMFSQPFLWLGGLLFWGVLMHIFARLLGGHGSIAGTLGLLSLSVAPRILDAFAFLTCAGGLLGLLGAVWGLVIYVKAIAVAQELSIEKAILAVVLPYIIFGLLAGLLVPVLIALTGGPAGG